jgi:hypothetical protein
MHKGIHASDGSRPEAVERLEQRRAGTSGGALDRGPLEASQRFFAERRRAQRAERARPRQVEGDPHQATTVTCPRM